MHTPARRVMHLGVVSFLNTRPLIDGLEDDARIRLHRAVPAALPDLLRSGQVQAALVPVIDLAREATHEAGQPAWQRISDACISSDGETMTVRVFSRVPPTEMTVLHGDTDSHTSVALARLIWQRYYRQPITFLPLGEPAAWDECEAVLLIGDKVVTQRPAGFDYEIDLGSAWKQWTGLPFVFAVWVAPADGDHDDLARLLSEARDRGVSRAPAIAAQAGPEHGWPVELATEYLTQRMIYTLTPAATEGMQRFLAMAAEDGIIASDGELVR